MLVDRQTHTDRQTDRNTPLPYWGGVKMMNKKNTYEIQSIALPLTTTKLVNALLLVF